MKAEDFIFQRYDGAYWFKVVGDSQKELTNRYQEQSMIEVSEVVYSPEEIVLGIKRLFPWNFDVIEVINPELEAFLIQIIDGLEKSIRQESEQAELLPQYLRTDLEPDSTKTATAQGKKESYWMVDKFRTWATCSNCGENLRLESGIVLFDLLPNYCMNCGNRMENGGKKY